MNDDIDLNFRPSSYFRPQRLEQYLVSRVKGGVLKQKLQMLFKEGRHSEVKALVGSKGISENDRKAFEAFHPMYMGGNYLPDTEHGEVEIARIRIKSTTSDITSVFANFDNGILRYRVVDEYAGETLTGNTETVSERNLTLAELADFFLAAWPLMDVLEMNFGGDLKASLDFFLAESDFYPEFDRLCRLRVSQHFAERSSKDASHDDNPMDDSIAILESLSGLIGDRDREKSFDMVTALLLETTKVFGQDPATMAKLFPLLEQIKNDIQQQKFDDALPRVLALLSGFRKVKQQYPSS
jgi:hypothetical protein